MHIIFLIDLIIKLRKRIYRSSNSCLNLSRSWYSLLLLCHPGIRNLHLQDPLGNLAEALPVVTYQANAPNQTVGAAEFFLDPNPSVLLNLGRILGELLKQCFLQKRAVRFALFIPELICFLSFDHFPSFYDIPFLSLVPSSLKKTFFLQSDELFLLHLNEWLQNEHLS